MKYNDQVCTLAHDGDVPADILERLPKNQGHPVRHRCAACAYVLGQRDAARRAQPDLSARSRLWAGRMFLLMVAELHRTGYEQLRIQSYMAPSGMHWRCEVVALEALRSRGDAPRARYSSASGFDWFNWGDCSTLPPVDLAERFRRSFPEILRAAHRPDAAYVTWFKAMLDATQPLGLVVEFDDFGRHDDALQVIGESARTQFAHAPV